MITSRSSKYTFLRSVAFVIAGTLLGGILSGTFVFIVSASLLKGDPNAGLANLSLGLAVISLVFIGVVVGGITGGFWGFRLARKS